MNGHAQMRRRQARLGGLTPAYRHALLRLATDNELTLAGVSYGRTNDPPTYRIRRHTARGLHALGLAKFTMRDATTVLSLTPSGIAAIAFIKRAQERP